MLYNYLLELGYSKKDISLIFDKLFVLNYDEEILYNKFKDNYEYLLSIGYSKSEIKKVSIISLFTYNVSSIKK